MPWSTDKDSGERLVEEVRILPVPSRVAFLDKLREVICIHCGEDQPATGGSCQCWNDE